MNGNSWSACPVVGHWQTEILRQKLALTRPKIRDDWVSGDDPITPSQASYLKTLSEQAQDFSAFEEKLTKAEASKRIDALKAKLGLSA